MTKLWERWALYLMGALVALCVYMFQDLKTNQERLAVQVQAMQIDKVSRAEMKELEDRLNRQIIGIKADIIERMDWHFRAAQNERNNRNQR